MQFSSISEFFHMGGYGFYVWLSYGATALLFLGLIITSRIRHKATLNDIIKRQQREERLRKAAEQMANVNSEIDLKSNINKEISS